MVVSNSKNLITSINCSGLLNLLLMALNGISKSFQLLKIFVYALYIRN